MALNPVDIVRLVGSGTRFQMRLLGFIADSVRGKAEDRDLYMLARDLYDVMGDVSEAHDELVIIATVAAIIVASHVVGAVEAAGLAGIVGEENAEAITAATTWATEQEARIQKEIDRAKGFLDEHHITELAAVLRTTHRVGMVVSPQYRRYIEAQMDRTADLAMEVFGQADYLNSAMVLLQGTIYDITALQGEGVDIAENRLFGTMADVTDQVARESRRYARSGGAFWYDLNAFFFRPLAAEREGIIRQKDGRVDTFINTASDASALANSTSTLLARFQRRADPFLDPEQDKWLRGFRRDFDESIADDLKEINRIIEVDLPAFELSIEEANNDIADQEQKIQEIEKLTADPNSLSDADKAAVAARHNTWIDNALQLTMPENTVFAAAVDRYNELLREAQEE